MKSAPQALTWEFWSRDKIALPFPLGICAAFVALLYIALLQDSGGGLDPSQASLMHSALFFCFVPIVGIAAASRADCPDRRFTLPVSMWTSLPW